MKRGLGGLVIGLIVLVFVLVAFAVGGFLILKNSYVDNVNILDDNSQQGDYDQNSLDNSYSEVEWGNDYYMGTKSKVGCLKNFEEAYEINKNMTDMIESRTENEKKFIGEKMSMSVFNDNKIYHECFSESNQIDEFHYECNGDKIILNSDEVFSAQSQYNYDLNKDIWRIYGGRTLYLMGNNYFFSLIHGVSNTKTFIYNGKELELPENVGGCFLNSQGLICPEIPYIYFSTLENSFKNKMVSLEASDEGFNLFLKEYNPSTGMEESSKAVATNVDSAKIFGDHLAYHQQDKNGEDGYIYYDGEKIGEGRFNFQIFGDHLAFISECEKSKCSDDDYVDGLEFFFYDGRYYNISEITGSRYSEVYAFSIFEDHVGIIVHDYVAKTSYFLYDFVLKSKEKGDLLNMENPGGFSHIQLSKDGSFAYVLNGFVYVNDIKTDMRYFHYMFEDMTYRSHSDFVSNDLSALSIRNCLQNYLETQVKTSAYGSVKFR
jgi:hypothetical protein